MLTTIDFKGALDLAQWLCTGVIAFVLWLRRPGEAAQDDAKKLRTHVDATVGKLHDRVVRLEHHSAQTPTKVELAELEGEVKAIRTQMANQDVQLLAIQRSVTRIEDFLLANARHGHQTNF